MACACCRRSDCCPTLVPLPEFADVWITSDPVEQCDGATGVLTWTVGACPVEGDPNRGGYVGDVTIGADTLHMVVCCPGSVNPADCTGTGSDVLPTAWLATFSDCGGDTDVNSSTGCGCCDVVQWDDPVIGACGFPGCITTAEFTPIVFMQLRCVDTGTSGMASPGPARAGTARGSSPMTATVDAAPTAGPGTELKSLLTEFGVRPTASCSCNAFARKMDGWGADGTRKRRHEAVQWLDRMRRGITWGAAFRAYLGGARNALSGGFVPDPGDVSGSLVDEACRRAEAAELKSRDAADVLPTGESAIPATDPPDAQ